MLQDGCPAVLEMVAEAEARDCFATIAASHGVPLRQIECVCPDRAVLLSRLARRPGDWAAILERVEKTYARPAREASLVLDTTSPPEELLAEAEAYLAGSLPPRHPPRCQGR
jgi:predicted kinase